LRCVPIITNRVVVVLIFVCRCAGGSILVVLSKSLAFGTFSSPAAPVFKDRSGS
jgi:hypothetical protein